MTKEEAIDVIKEVFPFFYNSLSTLIDADQRIRIKSDLSEQGIKETRKKPYVNIYADVGEGGNQAVLFSAYISRGLNAEMRSNIEYVATVRLPALTPEPGFVYSPEPFNYDNSLDFYSSDPDVFRMGAKLIINQYIKDLERWLPYNDNLVKYKH